MEDVNERIKWFELLRLIVHKESETALSVNGLVASIDKVIDDSINKCLENQIKRYESTRTKSRRFV